MPIFEYRATDAEGKGVSGTVQGATLDAAAHELAARGLTVQQVSNSSPKPIAEIPSPIFEPRSKMATDVVGPLVGRVSLSQLQFFFRQLATMLKAGVNPIQSFDTLARQSHSLKLQKIISELRDHTLAGRPMSFGMQRYPEVFNPLMMALVRAGEEGGFLDESLSQTADYLQREIELRNLIRRETFYPKLVIVASMIIISGANLVIATMASGAPGLSSPLTRIGTWFILGPILIALFLFFRIGLQNPRIKFNWDAFVANIPWVGGTVRGFAMAKFGRAFGALYKGGVPVHKGLRLAADACGNEYLRSMMIPASAKLEHGEGITDTLRETGAFSPIVLDMTATGEATGNLDLMLTKMAEYYEEEGAVQAKQMGLILGVVCFLAVAIYVAFLIIGFYSGYYSGAADAAREASS